MGLPISVKDIRYSINNEKLILSNINMQIPEGAFLAILGENGAGKTSLLDLVMGFKTPNKGTLLVNNEQPSNDPFEQRQRIAYLSEKVDLPGDWSVDEFLKFNRFFYKGYSKTIEAKLRKEFKVELKARIGNLSAGELRRVQIVAALSIQPELIVVDEITAVLDIVGRQKFLKILSDFNKAYKTTVVLATNILEDLPSHITHVCIMADGKITFMDTLSKFLKGKSTNHFSHLITSKLEAA
jgi:ABC-2 type transport system ATP-binding protein